MSKPSKKILFATNLSENCRAALEYSIKMSKESKGTLILLYVIDRNVPGHVEEHLKVVLGEEKWAQMIEEHEKDARNALIGKIPTSDMGRRAMKLYRINAGVDKENDDFNYREIVSKGDSVPKTIVLQAIDNQCELIVLGASRGTLTNNAIGAVIKDVLRNSKIPVLVVPPYLPQKR